MKPFISRNSEPHHSCAGYSGEAFIKKLVKRYRITTIDNRSCKLVSRRTNMTWKIEILPPSSLEA